MKKIILSCLTILILLFLYVILSYRSGLEIEMTKESKQNTQIDINWQQIQNETITLLSTLIQQKTVRGNEDLVTQIIAKKLKEENIPYKILEIPEHPNRTILFAWIEDESSKKDGIILASHSDVVEAIEKDESYPPFSGKVEQGRVWGRGAIDMKGMLAMEVMTMVIAKRYKIKLPRKTALLVLPDEETSGLGARTMIEKYALLIKDYKYMLNEGGIISHDIGIPGTKIINIQVAEKGPLWLGLRSLGNMGHGSMPPQEYATLNLINFLHALKNKFEEVQMTNSFRTYLSSLGDAKGGVSSLALKLAGNPLIFWFLKGKLQKSKQLDAMMKNTVSLTQLESPKETGPNVIPAWASAVVDMRLLPHEEPDLLFNEISLLASQFGISATRILSQKGNSSDLNSPFFLSLAQSALKEFNEANVAPLTSPGTTDNRFFRQQGMICFGLIPIMLKQDDLNGMHGLNENISIENLLRGTKVLTHLITDESF